MGHYADSNKGFAIGFDSENDFFQKKLNDSDWLRHLRRVEYQQSLNKPLTEITEIDFLYSKDPTWAYEKEFRIARPLSDATKIVQSSPYPIHLFEFPAKSVVEIVVGAKMDPEREQEIDQLLAVGSQYSHVQKRKIHTAHASKSLRVK